MLTQTEMESIESLVRNLNFEQVQAIEERLQMHRKFLATQSIRRFIIGDTVCFTNSKLGYRVGNITKVSRRYIHVQDGSTNWRVPAEMLTYVP